MPINCSLSTEEYASRRKVKPESVRAQLSKSGSYFGDVPIRQANGRLLWPDETVSHSADADAVVHRRAEKAMAGRLTRGTSQGGAK